MTTIEIRERIELDNHELYQTPGTWMFIAEIPENDIKKVKALEDFLESLGLTMDEQRHVYRIAK